MHALIRATLCLLVLSTLGTSGCMAASGVYFERLARKGDLDTFSEKLSVSHIFASRDGVKVVYPKANVVYLMLPPEWNFLAYNTKSLKRFDETHAKFNKNRAEYMRHRVSFPRVGSGMIAGVPTNIYRFRQAQENYPEALSVFAGIGDPTSKNSAAQLLEYHYSQKSLQDPLPDLLASLAWIPDLGGVPLACFRYSSTGKKELLWSVNNFKELEIPRSTFDIPKKLKHGFRWRDVVEPESLRPQEDFANSFLDSFAGNVDKPRAKSK